MGWGGGGFSLSICVSLFLSVCRHGERGSAAEAVLAPRLSPAPVTASIAVTLTPPLLSLEHLWACHSPGRGSTGGREASRGKSVLREICRGEGRQWRWRRSSGCRKESEVKTERKRIKEEVEGGI